MERPKRRITSRCLEYNGGMLHEEELALRRALQASLMASKTPILMQKNKKNANTGTTEDSADKSDKALIGSKKGSDKGNPKMSEKTFEKRMNKKRKSVGSKESETKTKRQKKLLVQGEPKVLRKETGKGEVLKLERKQKGDVGKDKRKGKEKFLKKGSRKKKKKTDGVDIKIDDHIRRANESAAHVVHAQRKFAQSNPSSPRSLLLYQSQMQPLKTRAKTEDFLDFLCLRGTSRLPKALELFNSPCAPLSPLTDDEESSKTSPSKISTNGQNSRSPPAASSDGETSAKRSLNLANECATKSSSSSTSNSSVSSPVSTRVQPHALLPHFTNTNYGILANIPSPIPYPRASSTFLTPPRSQALDAYGACITGPRLPPSSSCHPRVSSVATGMHRPSSCSQRGQGFYPVGQCLPLASDGGAGVTGDKCPVVSAVNSGSVTTLSKKVGRSPNKSPKGPQKSPKKGSVKTATKISQDSKGTSSSPEKNTLVGVAVNDNRVLVGQGLDEVPLFTPTEQEFKQPLKYIESIAARAEPYGICAILPPEFWKPDFCLSDDIRFTTKFQFIHRLGSRRPAVELQLAAVRKHLEKQNISLATMPQIAGCELDLPHMSKVVQGFGGLQQIIDKRKWGKVADTLRIPKTAVERSSKLEQIYYKFLLSFDLLSEEERNKLFESVQNEQNTIEESPTNTSREYMAKGRSMSLSVFQRTAKNVMDHHVKANANLKDVEKTLWRIQDEGQRYVVVHTAGFPHTAFPTEKGNPCSKSKWNLNVLPKTSASAVRDLTDVEGISSPLLKLEMAMSTSVWQKSPHGLYTIEYLHQGSDKIWYSIASDCQEKFSEVVSAEFNGKADVKDHMMSPLSLMKAGVPVYKIVQKPRQFIIKFPGAYHSSLSSGYAVSEAVFVAPLSHIQCGIKTSFQAVAAHHKVNQLFSWERLILSSLREELRRNSSENTLNILIPELEQIMSHEAAFRSEILKCGVVKKPEIDDLVRDVESSGRSLPCHFDQDEIINCTECNQYCFLSSTLDKSNQFLCLQHAVTKLRQLKKNETNMTLVVRLQMSKLDELLKEAQEKLQELQRKPKPVKRRLTTPSSGNNKNEKAS